VPACSIFMSGFISEICLGEEHHKEVSPRLTQPVF
jgi:hypothetical protein